MRHSSKNLGVERKQAMKNSQEKFAVTFRKITRADKKVVVDMMRKFYLSPALLTNGSEEIFANNVENCIKNSLYLEGFVFVAEDEIVGYGMIAKSFSTEFGSECIWIEDIYIEENFRGHGIGTKFIQYVRKNYPEKILRLEAEHDNEKAVAVYKNFGFEELPYLELVLK